MSAILLKYSPDATVSSHMLSISVLIQCLGGVDTMGIQKENTRRVVLIWEVDSWCGHSGMKARSCIYIGSVIVEENS